MGEHVEFRAKPKGEGAAGDETVAESGVDGTADTTDVKTADPAY